MNIPASQLELNYSSRVVVELSPGLRRALNEIILSRRPSRLLQPPPQSDVLKAIIAEEYARIAPETQEPFDVAHGKSSA